MSTHILDTHKYVKKFIEKGFNEEQSEAIIDFVSDFNAEKAKELATKGDIYELKQEMKQMSYELKNMILESKMSLIKWMVPLFLTNTVAMIMILAKIL